MTSLRPPAYVFVIRHGSRLDQADKNWHLSSSTPYDPPLTFGGWLQAQAVGARIAGILRQAEYRSDNIQESDNEPGQARRKKKKFKVAIHSSPFLRCVQTSVGISAGLAQPEPNQWEAETSMEAVQSPASASDSPPPLPPFSDAPPAGTEAIFKGIQKTPLRLDAFLGEWMNPEYFESISPPPGSPQMLSAAKVALLRKETISAYSPRPPSSALSQTHGQLWSAGPRLPERTGSVDSSTGLGLDGLSAMASALPRDRADSVASGSSQRAAALPKPEDGYVAPTPHYAIASGDKIPDGYVAHARDACTAADYQWDSSQPPWDWGDGGSYGEEWITMLRRFRKGFQKLMDWYAVTKNPTELFTKTVQSPPKEGAKSPPAGVAGEEATDDEEAEEESVVILVSHGAGCNAMIGAITRQPVLMDVGVASLTMAVRNNDKIIASNLAKPPSAGDPIPLDQFYDLKIQANNEHLRNISTTASGLARAPSNASSHGYNPNQQPRGRVSTMASYTPSSSAAPTERIYPELSIPGSRSNSANANLGSMRRTSYTTSGSSTSAPRAPPLITSTVGGITVGSGATSFIHSSSGNGAGIGNNTGGVIGLWSPSTPVLKRGDDDDDDMFPDFDGTRRFGVTPSPKSDAVQQQPEEKEKEKRGSVKSPSRLQEISRPASRDGDEEGVSSAVKGGGLWANNTGTTNSVS